ncbi:hypothetical protein [Nocardioides pinisoli]|uniref:Uncharacterized protein n=1 Tax=Nocardioides pinisoli TaxID=2950279 RepID=A0ABT1KSM9_9ACTN|nr:hypothetical protein [Nocardioides pinisoli]MCP3420326.1 hypothetical protein [Nocardioides pinisoli]
MLDASRAAARSAAHQEGMNDFASDTNARLLTACTVAVDVVRLHALIDRAEAPTPSAEVMTERVTRATPEGARPLAQTYAVAFDRYCRRLRGLVDQYSAPD